MEEKNHWMIDVNEQENPWIIQVNNQVKEIEDISMEEIEKNRWQRRSIYKVPESVKNLKGKEKTYKPQVFYILCKIMFISCKIYYIFLFSFDLLNRLNLND